MEKHLINIDNTLKNALQRMNDNRVKFFVAIDDNAHIVGTLTDGDIRRAILGGAKLEHPLINAVCKNFTAIDKSAGLTEVIDLFQNDKFEFLPVLNEDKTICNIITRRGLQVLLLTNKTFTIDYDFDRINENALEHNIFSRPWGFYKTTILNDLFQSKVINVLPGQSLSLQSHHRREEYWIVVNGEGIATIGASEKHVYPGVVFFIPKDCKHRLINTSATEPIIFIEVQLGDYFGEDDIVRYEDIYNRV